MVAIFLDCRHALHRPEAPHTRNLLTKLDLFLDKEGDVFGKEDEPWVMGSVEECMAVGAQRNMIVEAIAFEIVIK